MMEYELFKNIIQQRIMDYMPPIYREYVPTVSKVYKVNVQKDSFCLQPPEDRSEEPVPTIYMDDLYEMFIHCEDLDYILQETANIFMTWTGVDAAPLKNLKIRDNLGSIAAFLISTDLNAELLKTIPHTDFLNLSVIYRMVIRDEDDVHTMIINNSLLEELEMTTEQLHELAMVNTPNIFPLRIIEADDDGTCVMTNDLGFSGATVMIYPEAMKGMAKRMSGDFFIMPTSLHEFFAVGVEGADPTGLARLLAMGNSNVTRREDLLSGQIYRYIADTGEIVEAA